MLISFTAHHNPSEVTKDEYLTPPALLHSLGPFDLDPCAPITPPWKTAEKQYSLADGDGLALPWAGRVWCNPPYGRETGKWLQKLAEHGNGIALIYARTETGMFFEHVWPKASGVFFCKGRITFHHVDGKPARFNGGAPSCLVAYGTHNADVLAGLSSGQFVRLR